MKVALETILLGLVMWQQRHSKAKQHSRPLSFKCKKDS